MADQHRHQHQDITCREFVEIATEYLERALPEDRLQLVEEHLLICPPCITYLDQLEATATALPGAVVDDAPSDERREALLTMFRTWKSEH
jgi:hypothetical protein